MDASSGEDVEHLFEKSRVFRIVGDKKFVVRKPGELVPSWEVKDLLNMKRKLNAVKSSLDRMPADAWGALTRSSNVAALVVSATRTFAAPELCTQAWCKFYELLSKFPKLVEPEKRNGDKLRQLRTLHLCEAPGAFIAALNHHLTLRYHVTSDASEETGWVDVDDIPDNLAGNNEDAFSYSVSDEEDPNHPTFSCLGEFRDESAESEDRKRFPDLEDVQIFCDDLEWKWLANTLNPYHEELSSNSTIHADELICRTLPHWLFGPGGSGNLMDSRVSCDIRSRCRAVADLVTGDGGIDCAANPGEQELLVSDLVHCEVMTALVTLKPGGNFVLKIFTVFEAQTVALLYFLALAFDKVIVHKPVSSKPGNSELYVLCFGFGGLENQSGVERMIQYWDWMRANELQCGYSMPPLFKREEIPEAFIDEVIQMMDYFCTLQSDTIEDNLLDGMFESSARRFSTNVRDAVASRYLDICSLAPIPREKYLVGPRVLAEHNGPRTGFGGRDPVSRGRSYAERSKQRDLVHMLKRTKPETKDLKFLETLEEASVELLRDLMLEQRAPGTIKNNDPDLSEELSLKCDWTYARLRRKVKVEMGTPVNKILSSPYFPSSYLDHFYELYDLLDLVSDMSELPDTVVNLNGWPSDIQEAFSVPPVKNENRVADLSAIFRSGGHPSVDDFQMVGRELRVAEESVVFVNVMNLGSSPGYQIYQHPNADAATQSSRTPCVIRPPMPLSFQVDRFKKSVQDATSFNLSDPHVFLRAFRSWLQNHPMIHPPSDVLLRSLLGEFEIQRLTEGREQEPGCSENNRIETLLDSVFGFVMHVTMKPHLFSSFPSVDDFDIGEFPEVCPSLKRKIVAAILLLFDVVFGCIPDEPVLFLSDKQILLDLVPEMSMVEEGDACGFQRLLTDKIIDCLGGACLKKQTVLVFRGMHMLTRFSVSVFLLLSTLFHECSVRASDECPELVLRGFVGQMEDVTDFLELVSTASKSYSSCGSTEDDVALSLFDCGPTSPILRSRKLNDFASLVNAWYLQYRIGALLTNYSFRGPRSHDFKETKGKRVLSVTEMPENVSDSKKIARVQICATLLKLIVGAMRRRQVLLLAESTRLIRSRSQHGLNPGDLKMSISRKAYCNRIKLERQLLLILEAISEEKSMLWALAFLVVKFAVAEEECMQRKSSRERYSLSAVLTFCQNCVLNVAELCLIGMNVFLFDLHVSVKKIQCYVCDSMYDPRCLDPFNFTTAPPIEDCHGCCVKLVTNIGSDVYVIRRLCTKRLSINLFMVDHVCMREGDRTGRMCFCEDDLCNKAVGNFSLMHWCTCALFAAIVFLFSGFGIPCYSLTAG
ncbi:unnamed protein product [Notodromas monacha]|uniref:Cap-specific mRNA (nucleoside-2'-O-)-methyltransferase 2 n=1 Tax=Notodromas monacha TaxID=399045 RepID=A0A7R9G9N2_9CRUS|nr:unnamed protein product [Notodromas monacha]CAG0914437.1 unnamed protein product [Notodromas monacha]